MERLKVSVSPEELPRARDYEALDDGLAAADDRPTDPCGPPDTDPPSSWLVEVLSDLSPPSAPSFRPTD